MYLLSIAVPFFMVFCLLAMGILFAWDVRLMARFGNRLFGTKHPEPRSAIEIWLSRPIGLALIALGVYIAARLVSDFPPSDLAALPPPPTRTPRGPVNALVNNLAILLMGIAGLCLLIRPTWLSGLPNSRLPSERDSAHAPITNTVIRVFSAFVVISAIRAAIRWFSV